MQWSEWGWVEWSFLFWLCVSERVTGKPKGNGMKRRVGMSGME